MDFFWPYAEDHCEISLSYGEDEATIFSRPYSALMAVENVEQLSAEQGQKE